MKTHSSFQARVVQFGVWSLLSFIPCIGVANATAAPLLHDLNLLAATQHSQANAVSGNGKVVVGLAWDSANTPWIFRWTADGGTQYLDGVAIQGSANAVNATGTVIVGAIGSNASQRAFRWEAASGLQDLGDLGGALTVAWGVNADGSVVVGQSDNVSAVRRAFRWTSALGMQDLGSRRRRLERCLCGQRRRRRGGGKFGIGQRCARLSLGERQHDRSRHAGG